MIRHLTGTVIDTTLTNLVLNVQGVGYLIHPTAPGTDYALESTQSFWTYLAVRETVLDLYGFTTRDELEIFELLLTLPKIGPKSAAQILGQADIDLLKQAVSQQDASYLSKMSGIGKKTAEKITAGLQEPFVDRGLTADTTDAALTPLTRWQQEAIDALITLGYPQKDARDTVHSLPAEISDTTTALKEALKVLSN